MSNESPSLNPDPSADCNLFAALQASWPRTAEGRQAVAIETDDGLHYTWDDLDRGTGMMANLLASLEIPAGSRIAAQVDKSVEALLLYLATLRAGFVYLPLNNAYQQAELDYFIGNAEPAVVVCAGRSFPWLSKLAFQHGVRHVFTLNDDRSGTWLDRAAAFPDAHDPVPRRADDLAAILYTSGTTGRSKGAMLTHGNLLSNAQVLRTHWDWRADDVLIHTLPIFHVHGLFVACHGALLNGTPMLWMNRFDAAQVVRWMPRATMFMGVPTLYVRLLQEVALDRAQASRMRLFISGSAPLLIETFRDWQKRTGHTILERYGMSETIMLTSNPCRPEQGERLGGTVGPALPGVGVRVVDDEGQVRGAGAVGHVQVRGPNVFSGYWRMPEKTAEEFVTDAEGQRWFKTGDVGEWTEEGYLRIVGRSKDVVITGGYNVYPAEIEGFLNELPGVQESAVIGVPHPDFGEAVVAVVVPRPGAQPEPERLVAALKARIAGFKVPKHIAVVEALPRNVMGKVQKNLLRETHGDLFANSGRPR